MSDRLDDNPPHDSAPLPAWMTLPGSLANQKTSDILDEPEGGVSPGADDGLQGVSREPDAADDLRDLAPEVDAVDGLRDLAPEPDAAVGLRDLAPESGVDDGRRDAVSEPDSADDPQVMVSEPGRADGFEDVTLADGAAPRAEGASSERPPAGGSPEPDALPEPDEASFLGATVAALSGAGATVAALSGADAAAAAPSGAGAAGGGTAERGAIRASDRPDADVPDLASTAVPDQPSAGESMQPAAAEVPEQSHPDASEQPSSGAPIEPAESGPTLGAALEAILMVVDEPVPEVTLAQVLERPTHEVSTALRALAAEYTQAGRGFDLREVAGGWRFYTRADCAALVERFVRDGQQTRLTQAALETLAVVAYRQPVSRARVAAVRGVNSDGVMRTLVARGLVEEAGTDPESQAVLYRTSSYFLERLGLKDIGELPELAPFLPDDVENLEENTK